MGESLLSLDEKARNQLKYNFSSLISMTFSSCDKNNSNMSKTLLLGDISATSHSQTTKYQKVNISIRLVF